MKSTKPIQVVIILLVCTLIPFNLLSQKYGKVDIALLEQKEHPVYPEANASYVVKNCNTYYEWGGAKPMLVSEYWVRVKVYKEDGIKLANFDKKLYKNGLDKTLLQGVKSQSYNLVDGKVIKTKLKKRDIYRENYNENFNMVRLAVPSVKVGSVFDLKYKVMSPFLYSTPKHYFQSDIPVEKSVYSIYVPEYFTMTPIPTGATLISRSKEPSMAKGYSSENYRFTAKNIEPLEEDAYVLNINDYRSSIKYELYSVAFPYQKVQRYSESWDQIATNLMKSKSFGKVLNRKVKEASHIMEHALTLSEDERLRFLYDHVREHVTWNGDYGKYCEQNPSKVYKTKSGSIADINLLLLNLLKHSDIDASPLITKSRTSGMLNYNFPTLTELHYVAVVIPTNESYLILDASSKYVPFGQLPIRAMNKYGVIVKAESGEVIEIPNTNKIVEQKFAKLNINLEDLSLDGQMTSKRSHFAATKFRIDLDENEENEDNQNLEEDDEYENNIEEDDDDHDELDMEEDTYFIINTEGVEDVNSAIKHEINVKLYKPIQAIGSDIFIDAFVIENFEKNPFINEKRDFSAFFNSKYDLTYISMINKPNGYVVKSYPDPIKLTMSDGKGEFTYVLSEDENKISIRSILKINETIFSPEEYDMLRRFFEALLQKQNEKIILTKI